MSLYRSGFSHRPVSPDRKIASINAIFTGRIADEGVAGAFRTAFQSIKPNDGVFVGMFPKYKDEVKENAEIVHRILAGA